MSKKTVKMTNEGINRLPEDRPVLYKILDPRGNNIYTGVAKRGNVHDRLADHMPGHRDAVPGAAKVQVEQMSSINHAEKKEQAVISRSKPKYNQRGK